MAHGADQHQKDATLIRAGKFMSPTVSHESASVWQSKQNAITASCSEVMGLLHACSSGNVGEEQLQSFIFNCSITYIQNGAPVD